MGLFRVSKQAEVPPCFTIHRFLLLNLTFNYQFIIITFISTMGNLQDQLLIWDLRPVRGLGSFLCLRESRAGGK